MRTATVADLGLLLGVYALWHRAQLQLELGLWRHRKDEVLQGCSVLVAQEEDELALAALVLRLQTNLHNTDRHRCKKEVGLY